MTDLTDGPRHNQDQADDLDDLSPEELEGLERELGLSDLSFQRGSPSPLLAARIAAARARGTPQAEEAARRYEALRGLIDRLNLLKPPMGERLPTWGERLSLLRELEADEGWQERRTWARLRRDWLYRGPEWRIPISDQDCARLEELGNAGDPAAWRKAVADILRAWYERNSTLAGQVLHDPDGVWFVAAWVACRVWAGEPAYADWLLRRIVRPATRRFSMNLPPLLRTTQDLTTEGGSDRDPGEIAIHEGYFFLLDRVIPRAIGEVQGSLTKYWRQAVRNFLLDKIRRERRLASLDALREGAEHELAPVDLLESVDAETALAEIDDQVSAPQSWCQLRRHLTEKQQQVLLAKAGLDRGEVLRGTRRHQGRGPRSNPEVAVRLRIPLRGQVRALLDNLTGDALEVALTAGAVRSV